VRVAAGTEGGDALTIPETETIQDERFADDLRREREEEEIADHFSHIVCFLCYPEFAEKSVAPHDAQCICGKPVRAGDTPGPSNAPSCVLCNEMANGHYRKKHARL
jgi:hypothetical protein